MTWRAMIQPDFAADGIAITLGDAPEGGGRLIVVEPAELVMRLRDRGEEATILPPSLRMPDSLARALLDALSLHYGGAIDVRTTRQDLLAERERSNRMLDALIDIARREAAA